MKETTFRSTEIIPKWVPETWFNTNYYPELALSSSEHYMKMASHLDWSDSRVEQMLSRATNPWSDPRRAALYGVGGIVLPYLKQAIGSFLNPEIRHILWKREVEAMNKWGPRSNIAGLSDEFSQTLKILRSKHNDAGVNLPIQMLSRALMANVYPISLQRAVQTVPLQTSYGAPLFGRKSKHLKELVRVSQALYNEVLANDGDAALSGMFVASKRAREGKIVPNEPSLDRLLGIATRLSDNKYLEKTGARFVHMSPAPEVVVISIIGEGIKQALETSGYHHSKLGPDALDGWVKSELRKQVYTWFSLDAEKFDLYATRRLIQAAHEVIRSIPAGYSSVWQKVTTFSLKQMLSPAIMVTGNVVSGDDAAFIKSGHRLTNDVDSIITLLILFNAIPRLGLNLDDVVIQVNGDDAIIGVPAKLDPASVLEVLSNSYRNAGMRLNPAKQLISSNMIEMNNRVWARDTDGTIHGPLPSVIRILNSLLYPERLGGVEVRGDETVDTVTISLQHLQILSNLVDWPYPERLIHKLLSLDSQYKPGRGGVYIKTLAPSLEDAINVSGDIDDIKKVYVSQWSRLVNMISINRLF